MLFQLRVIKAKHRNHCCAGQNKEPALMGQYAESRPGIQDIGDMKEIFDDGNTLSRRHR